MITKDMNRRRRGRQKNRAASSSPRIHRGKTNIPVKSPIAGLLVGKYGADASASGFGRLSRLRERAASVPVVLDELDDRYMIRIGMVDMAPLCEA